MDQDTRKNWHKIKDALEATEKTNNWYYRRALAITQGDGDPLDGSHGVSVANINRST